LRLAGYAATVIVDYTINPDAGWFEYFLDQSLTGFCEVRVLSQDVWALENISGESVKQRICGANGEGFGAKILKVS